MYHTRIVTPLVGRSAPLYYRSDPANLFTGERAPAPDFKTSHVLLRGRCWHVCSIVGYVLCSKSLFCVDVIYFYLIGYLYWVFSFE